LPDIQDADVAQLVEQLIRNQQVSGSIPLIGSIVIDFSRLIPVVIPGRNFAFAQHFYRFDQTQTKRCHFMEIQHPDCILG
jgi:hypothetical protein